MTTTGRRTPSQEHRRAGLSARSAAAAALAAFVLGAAPVSARPFRDVEIRVLSNRADLVSGGDALVEIVLPADADAAAARVTVNGEDRTDAFAVREDGRYVGLVTGLADGANQVAAWVGRPERKERSSRRGIAHLTITSHPRGGPVFSGAQLEPWICARPVFPPATTPAPVPVTVPGTALAATVTPRTSGLDDEPDAQCNASTTYTFWYQPKAREGTSCAFTNGVNACFVPYDPAVTPDADVASFTNDRGDTVRAIVVLERGTLDRGIYQLVTFLDPKQPYAPWAPQRGWNGKLLWRFTPSGGYAGSSRFQTPPGTSVWDDAALRRGYMVASSSLTDHGTNANDTLAAEAMMMVKEHIAETYGPIRFTIGSGCSGGAISQYAIAAAYPGLLDGIQPNCSFPDTITTAIELQDCGLLFDRYYRTPAGLALGEAQRAAIDGHLGTRFCAAWVFSFLPSANPSRAANCGSGFPAALTYDATLLPDGTMRRGDGVRCTSVDHDASLLGTSVDADGVPKASSPFDNVGVQYGLAVLRDGILSAEEFVSLNEGVGSYTADQVWTGTLPTFPVPRRAASPKTLRSVYTAGLASDGRQLARAAIIDLRGNQNGSIGDIHMNWRSWSVRDRLDRSNGHHENQLIWAFDGGLLPGTALALRSLDTLDRWLTSVEEDVTDATIEERIVRNRPADATDRCIAAGVDVGLSTPECPVTYQASPRQVAGGPLAEDVLKCQLKPLDLSSPEYGGAVFTSEQQARLAAVFPEGVCDWSKPGVEQVPADGWATFADGPGGRPLGPPPDSAQDCSGSSRGRGHADGADYHGEGERPGR